MSGLTFVTIMIAQPTTSSHTTMAAFPPPPAEAIQWAQLGFDIMEGWWRFFPSSPTD